jgi:competence protein ComEA
MRRFIGLLLVSAGLIFSTPALVPAVAAPVQATARASINVNVASVKQLESLPGVGPVTAKRIIDYRTANGRFASAEGLLKVKGVGKKTLEKIRQRIVVQ